MKTLIKNLINKYIGKIEYVVTILNVDGEGKQFSFHTLKEVDDFVISINKERYWDVQKIEKFRRYSFVYDKQVIHSPLWFRNEDVTETHIIRKEYDKQIFNRAFSLCDGDKDMTEKIHNIIKDHEFSFLKKHGSLSNVTRVESKHVEAI
jgi:hypothetical protein